MNGTTRLAVLLGTWGKPVDKPALWALVIAGALLVVAALPETAREAIGIPTSLPRKPEWRWRIVFTLGMVAAFLSLGYIAVYLHAGPRIIDATSYFLEGRVLSHGHLAWSVPTPTASFRGRFLLFHETAQGGKLSVIFPPGYPLVLAAGFLVGAPLVVGPLLAAGIVAATYWLTLELAGDREQRERHAIALLGAVLSIVCAALRYHTADTMSHGASALGVTLGLAAALRGSANDRASRPSALPWVLAGLAIGYVVCTRPVSSISVAGVVFLVSQRSTHRARLVPLLVGMTPGVGFLLAASHAQTGSWLLPAQSAYYATSDGPPGCFHFGFGPHVGCLEEHKDFVLSRLPHGYGAKEAALVTLRRLRLHLVDIANFEPLALLVLLPLRPPLHGSPPEATRARYLLGVVGLQVLCYAPFYFDGSYPGGGARFFADILPVEHALVALATASIFPHVSLFRRAAVVVALALAGFGVHAAFEHKALAERDGGHPLYDPEEGRNVGKGILFFDTDHGFDLAYDPYVDESKGFIAARLRGDDHDRLLVERLEHPQAHVYRQDAKRSSVQAWTAKAGGNHDLWHFEAEADWPPLFQSKGWVEPAWASNSCASDGRVLTLHPEPRADGTLTGATARAEIELPVPRTGKWAVTPRVMRRGGPGKATLRLVPLGRPLTDADAKLVWQWRDDELGAKPGKDVCADLPTMETVHGVPLEVTGARLVLEATDGDVSIDQTSLRAGR